MESPSLRLAWLEEVFYVSKTLAMEIGSRPIKSSIYICAFRYLQYRQCFSFRFLLMRLHILIRRYVRYSNAFANRLDIG